MIHAIRFATPLPATGLSWWKRLWAVERYQGAYHLQVQVKKGASWTSIPIEQVQLEEWIKGLPLR